MAFENLINPIFNPLLKLPNLYSIIIISFVIAVLITLVYKWMTDQHLMKTLKDDMKNFRDEMKAFKEDPQKVMEIQKRAMETNMKYMMHSMKPTLVTFIPIIIIFGWLNAHMAFIPIMPGEEFTTTAIFEENIAGEMTIITPEEIEIIGEAEQEIQNNQITWRLKGDAGEYLLEYSMNNKKYTKDLLITNEKEYKEPIARIKDGTVNTIMINQEKVKPLNLFGWEIGWLGTYIIFSIIFSMTLRKILKLH